MNLQKNLTKKFLKNLRKGGKNPMDTFEITTQYVSGMANEEIREEGLYHR
ncbi:MAG: hypothetical protein UHS49_04005 [Faecalimonas sp.]|nr:hypothetical protein [Faecalimonas sp.]